MKRIICLSYLLTLSLFAYCQSAEIIGRIIDDDNNPIANASIMVYSQDSTLLTSGFSDYLGEFRIQTDSIKNRKIKISCLGFKTIWKSFPLEGDIKLMTDTQLLSEIVVKGKRNFTKPTTTGFFYDLSNIDFIRGQNLLQAIQIIPFVDIDSHGLISINGAKGGAIFLNGKPYDMAMTNPIQILQSISAKDIKSIEVITQPDPRFGNNIPAINLITYSNSLDGIYLNGSLKFQTIPTANAGISFLANKKLIDFSFSYNYDYQNQHNQPIFQSVTTNDVTTLLQGKGNGNWHTHILRGLASWRVDSLNIIYADVHAKINNDLYTTKWKEYIESLVETRDDNFINNQSSATKGTLETNIIYRNYFRHNRSQEHFMAGYRYTYNPDKRNYLLTDSDNSVSPLIQKTNGGINEHTLNLLFIMPFSDKHQLSIGARSIFRKADVNSTDSPSLSYTQSISYPFLDYIGNLKWFNAAIKLSFEYENLSMHNGNTYNKSGKFYFLPSLNIFRSFNKWRVNFTYNRQLQRPSIYMLNPFYDSKNNLFHEMGNPDLKAELKDVLGIGTSFFKNRVSLSLGITYMHTYNAILYYQKESADLVGIISTYGNIGRLNTLTGNLFLNWQPVSSLVLKFNINGGFFRLTSRKLNLSQKDYTLNLFGWIDYYLSNNWNIGMNVMHFKQAPEPYGTINAITNYSAHVGKTWLKGSLSTSIEISNPFTKYSKLKTTVSNGLFSTIKVNYMKTRYVGLNISYTFQYGKKSNLKRDSSLSNSDQASGVQ